MTPNDKKYVAAIKSDLERHKKHNKLSVEKLATSFGIVNKNMVKELTELAIVNIARKLARQNKPIYDRFAEITQLYHHQVNLSHRTSESIRLQQYSTPAPITFLAGIFCRIDRPGLYFEPSAGNGLMTIAGNPADFIVNEVDDIRRGNLQTQGFREVLDRDASKPFPKYAKTFDAVLTNPPFGTLPEPEVIGTYWTKILDHKMAVVALETMKNNGKAAIIIGGHTKFDEKGRIQKGKNRDFFLYLYRHYNVMDVINIDGHKLFSRQGTAFDVRLILIDGRKETPGGFPPLDKSKGRPVDTFDNLYNRVMKWRGEEKGDKEPWEMTRDEFVQIPRFHQYLFADKSKLKKDVRQRSATTQKVIDKTRVQTKGMTGEESPTKFYSEGRNLHKEIVRKALSEGKPVPKKVLKDYPELQKKSTKTTKQEQQKDKEPWQMTIKEAFNYMCKHFMLQDYGHTAESRANAEINNQEVIKEAPKLKWNDEISFVDNYKMIAAKLFPYLKEVAQYCYDENSFLFFIKNTGGLWSVLYKRGYDFAEDYFFKALPYINKLAGLNTKKRKNFDTKLFIEKYGNKAIVKKALSEGKPVPKKVLKDYPDLQKKATPPSNNYKYTVGEKVSFISTGHQPKTGVVKYLSEAGRYEVKTGKTTLFKVNEKDLVPAVKTAHKVKETGGYNAFKNLKLNTRQEYEVIFSDGQKLTVFAGNRSEAITKAILHRLEQQSQQVKADMSPATARKLGEKAFKDGKKRVFAQDKEAVKLLEGRTVGDGSSAIMDAWYKGWDEANLNKPLPDALALAEAEAEAEMEMLELMNDNLSGIHPKIKVF